MSGMDRLTDEALERKSARFKATFKDDEGASCKLEATISANQFEAINLVLWGAVDARAVIAMKDDADDHRRASQAAPVAWRSEDRTHPGWYYYGDAAQEPKPDDAQMLYAAPAPSDGLREARVNTLEWGVRNFFNDLAGGEDRICAETPFGYYYVWALKPWGGNGWRASGPNFESVGCETEDDAKIAAREHYTASILSALRRTAPTEGEA